MAGEDCDALSHVSQKQTILAALGQLSCCISASLAIIYLTFKKAIATYLAGSDTYWNCGTGNNLLFNLFISCCTSLLALIALGLKFKICKPCNVFTLLNAT